MFTENHLSPASTNRLALPIKPEEINARAMYQALLPDANNPYIQLTEAVKLNAAQNIINGLQTLVRQYPGVYDTSVADELTALVEHLRADGVDTTRLALGPAEDFAQLTFPVNDLRPWQMPYSPQGIIPAESLTEPRVDYTLMESTTFSIPASGGAKSLVVQREAITTSLESASTPYTTQYDPKVTIRDGEASLWNPQSASVIEVTISDATGRTLYTGMLGGREHREIEIPELVAGAEVQVRMRYR